MDKIRITSDEVAQVADPPPPPQTEARLIPIWLRLLSSLLLLFPPLLYILTVTLLFRMRNRPLDLKYAWSVHFCYLLVASGVVCTTVTLAIGLAGPPPTTPDESAALTLPSFPSAPSTQALSAKDIAHQLRPLVLVVHRSEKRFPFSPRSLYATQLGAAAIIQADATSCLALTSRHVVQHAGNQHGLGQLVVVADEGGTWVSAQVIGSHRDLDLALLWFKHTVATNVFIQPIRPYSSINVGDTIFVIGHPEGLEFSISTGIVSQKRGDDLLQFSAPVSPGSSGGPVYDEHGSLLGIVQSVTDKKRSPNAENLNFAVRADALLETRGWELDSRAAAVLEALRQHTYADERGPEIPPQVAEETK